MQEAPDLRGNVAHCWALIPAAGSGSRAGPGQPKQYRLLAGQTLLMHTLAAFAAVPELTGVLVVIAPDAPAPELVPVPNATLFVAPCGGSTRAASVLNGLNAIAERGARASDWVLVHDAARCLITPELIQSLLNACRDDVVGGLLALPVSDTLKRADCDGRVTATLPRDACWLAQTPQMFRLGALQQALEQGAGSAAITDEASAMEAQGQRPRLVLGSPENFKVTYAADFVVAEAVLAARRARQASQNKDASS